MGYYLRAFCTGSSVPSLQTIFAWTAKQGSRLFVENEDSEPIDMQSTAWGQPSVSIGCRNAFLPFIKGKVQFVVEINRQDDPTTEYEVKSSNIIIAHNAQDVATAIKESLSDTYAPSAVALPPNTGQNLLNDEIEEFIELISDEDDSSVKAFIIDHLRKTNYIVACQLLSTIDNSGYNGVGDFLNYFVKFHGGLIHAEDEGFYQGKKVILAVG
jgi:hypothetical protein